MPLFLTDPPRFLFFTGKGGVGKTSIACASAVELAEQGRSVLLVSTDPASNVAQVLGAQIGSTITPIPQVPGLSAVEIDPEQAAAGFRERVVGPVRDLLPASEIAAITEQLSGSCTTEIASFNEFTALLCDESIIGAYDHIVFDTAPTGHTLRLLQLPGSWTEYLNDGKGDASCLGPLAGLDQQRSAYAGAVAALTDPAQTRLILVARPDTASLAEIGRTNSELSKTGVACTNVVLNGLLPPQDDDDATSQALRKRQLEAIESIPEGVADLPRDRIRLSPVNMVGLPALRTLFQNDPTALTDTTQTHTIFELPGLGLSALVDEISAQDHGLILCMGKGGVGKTTIAAAVATELAGRGKQVHLTTTDPAANVAETVQGTVPGLRVSRIDPAAATQEYRDRIMSTKGKALDEAGRANLAEDLLSPCTEEVAVFQQFSKAVSESRREFVIVDTAPTGHTLLLLDAAGSYHREVARQMGDSSHYTTPLMRLQDPEQTKVILVTLAETTPVREAQTLQEDLQRAGITPWAWVINNVLAAAQPRSALLRERAAAELDQVAMVESVAERFAVVPLVPAEPVGTAGLAQLLNPLPASENPDR